MFGRNLCANSTNINEKLSMQISLWSVSKERKSTLLTTAADREKKTSPLHQKVYKSILMWKKNGENQNIEITNECQYQIAMMYVHRTEAQHWCD